MNPAQDQGDDSGITDVAAEALQRALASEHAAIWAFSLATAFVPPDQEPRVRSDLEGHKQLRSFATAQLSQIGKRPVSAQPAYSPPQPVVDAVSAGALLVAAETDTVAAWRSLLERSTSTQLRAIGLRAMVDSTGRLTFWRGVTDRSPAVPVFPGRG
ncbi:ferritin-like domain-containing protein [Pseudonocardia endophytica]|uniref:Uncharacterized protein DUF4439 n=1 Tax=Pseudonocardia endophytica TaxID=401976 RepID=A0A4R1HVB0_PSEEN|nr:ferritin-like domain-containing protein [Pseudonocardia endophytica]TCK25361.1 uncharacterized protein DUF4439 [Pseudonocardia endophytica]